MVQWLKLSGPASSIPTEEFYGKVYLSKAFPALLSVKIMLMCRVDIPRRATVIASKKSIPMVVEVCITASFHYSHG